MEENIYMKVQELESELLAQSPEQIELLQRSYQNACDVEDAENAAKFARKIRNRLLEESDCIMAFDRLGLTVPSGSTFTVWLSFLRSLGDVLTGSWATYRQALRDLPQQEGFPFNVTFPEKPQTSEGG